MWFLLLCSLSLWFHVYSRLLKLVCTLRVQGRFSSCPCEQLEFLFAGIQHGAGNNPPCWHATVASSNHLVIVFHCIPKDWHLGAVKSFGGHLTNLLMVLELLWCRLAVYDLKLVSTKQSGSVQFSSVGYTWEWLFLCFHSQELMASKILFLPVSSLPLCWGTERTDPMRNQRRLIVCTLM